MQSFIVLASLVSELALTLQKNTLVFKGKFLETVITRETV